MSDPTPSNDSLVHALLFICNGLLLAITGLGTWMLNLYRRKVDRLEQKQYITREELDDKFTLMQQDRFRMHEEFMSNMRELRGTINAAQSETGRDIRALNQRIDISLKRSGR